jgi:hypothetical protein
MQRWRSGLWKAMKRGLSEMVSLLLESTKFKLWENGGYERFAIIDKVRAQRMLLSAGDEVAGVVSDSAVLCKNKGFVPCCGQEERFG